MTIDSIVTGIVLVLFFSWSIGHESCLDAATIMQVSLRLPGLELLSLNIHLSSGEVWADHMPELGGLSATEQPEKVLLTVASKCLMLLFCEPAIQPVLLELAS